MAPIGVLVVAAEPDERPSTVELRRLCDALARRPDVHLSVWFLRDYHRERWPGTRNVDDLRTWWPNQLFEVTGLGRLGGPLRGRRLRRWFRDADPQVVILDDGFGERLLGAAPRRPAVVVRRNEDLGRDFGFEEAPLERGDLTIVTGGDVPDGPGVVELPVHGTDTRVHLAEAASARAAGREGFDLPVDVPLVVGWGSDGWVDGSDLFVRTLWFLEHRHGIAAHGLWLGPVGPRGDEVELERIRSEAERCGVEGRIHLREDDDRRLRYVGDVVLLPTRVPLERDPVLSAGAAQVPLVAFEPSPWPAPWVEVVPYLDLPALAAAVARGLGAPDDAARERWLLQVDLDRFLDQLLPAALAARSG